MGEVGCVDFCEPVSCCVAGGVSGVPVGSWSEGDVVEDGEVGEEVGVLGGQDDSSLVCGGPGGVVNEGASVEGDVSGVGGEQSGNDLEGGCFP